MESLRHDIIYSWRSLRQARGFAIVVVLTLAIGIGINSAMFSALDAMLIQPLPFHDPDRLTMVWANDPRLGGIFSTRLQTSLQDFRVWASQAHSFEKMGFIAKATYNLTNVDLPERIESAAVSPDFFDVLGVSPSIGRNFAADDGAPGKNNVAILSYGLYQRRFAEDPHTVGRIITLDGESYTVIGIMPPRFQLAAVSGGFDRIGAQIWVPMNQAMVDQRKQADVRFLMVIARFMPQATLQQARNEMNVIAKRLQQERPDTDEGVGASVFSMRTEDVGDDMPRVLVTLQGAAAFVLLIVCANLANLMLARTTRRRRDIAVRLALGAQRSRIARQMLVESLMLSMFGGLAALGIGELLMIAINHFGPVQVLSDHQLRLGPWVLVFTLLSAIFTGVLFGTAPAFHAVRQNINEVLKRTSRAAGRLDRTRSMLVIAEVALSFILLVGGGLMVRSLLSVLSMNQGYVSDHLLTAQVRPAGPNYQNDQQLHAFCEQILSRLQKLPGVWSASLSSGLPLRRVHADGARLEGQSDKDAQPVDFQYVSEDYFQTMGSPLLYGRQFTLAEAENKSAVAIVNQTLADHFWPGQSPLGKSIILDKPATVVGVVPDTHQLGPETPSRPEMYLPSRSFSEIYITLHTATNPMALATPVQKTIQAIDNTQPVFDITPMSQTVGEYVADRRFGTWLIVGFAGFAVLLAAIGIYSLLAYVVSQRTHEIGVRMALGAQMGDVITMVLRQAVLLTLCGLALGLAGALALTRIVSSFVFGVQATDPAAFLITIGILIVIPFVAGSLPARRAAKVDPVVALRAE